MSVLPTFNRPRITPFNPDADPIILGDSTEPNIQQPSMLPQIRPTQGSPQATMPPMSPIGSSEPEDDRTELMKAKSLYDSLYHPETDNIDKMNNMINTMPVRKEPGMMRKIFGGLAQVAGGGPEANEAIRYAPFNRQMDDWERGMKPVESAANIERQNNANSRMVASQIVNNDVANRRLEATLGRNAVLGAQGERRLDQADTKIDLENDKLAYKKEIDALRAQGGKAQLDESTGEWYMVYNENVGGVQVPRKVPLNMSKLSETDRLQTIQDYALERIRTAGAQARDTKATPNAGSNAGKVVPITDPTDPTGKRTVMAIISPDEASYRIVRESPKEADEEKPKPGAVPKKVAVKPEPKYSQATDELGKARALAARANQVRLENPAWNKWIKVVKGVPDIKKPSIWIPGTPSKEEYVKMYKAVYGEDPVDTDVLPAVVQDTQSNPNVRNGQTRVMNPEGKLGWWTTTALSQMPKGWKVVQ